ncbi:hypothetical protein B0H19DRAFT_1077824 [Mycena capillaripes]|nr:hypothetical protein B0H19DRAFT_1077824 [Mycena capillaripes]
MHQRRRILCRKSERNLAADLLHRCLMDGREGESYGSACASEVNNTVEAGLATQFMCGLSAIEPRTEETYCGEMYLLEAREQGFESNDRGLRQPYAMFAEGVQAWTVRYEAMRSRKHSEIKARAIRRSKFEAQMYLVIPRVALKRRRDEA